MSCIHFYEEDWLGEARCKHCDNTPAMTAAQRRPLLLMGGPLELDGTEIPDNEGSTVRNVNGSIYFVIRDWKLDRWVGIYQERK